MATMIHLATIETTTYRNHTIALEIWAVNGQDRWVYVLDGGNAASGHYDSLEDAQRACRRRN